LLITLIQHSHCPDLHRLLPVSVKPILFAAAIEGCSSF
jgi:hypothetical protein